jgi:endonuclease III
LALSECVKKLISFYGEPFSSKLGINLASVKSEEVFKWFMASILFGARISESIATNTYRKFEEYGVMTPEKILETGWDGLVQILDEGGYVRYDFKTATKLLEVMKNLLTNYSDLNTLHDKASNPRDLEQRLMKLGKGIGPVTVNIFLRELRGRWSKADPLPEKIVMLVAYNLGFTEAFGMSEEERSIALLDLKNLWNNAKIDDKTFVDFEAALVRYGKDYCNKGRCSKCELINYCKKGR